MRIKNIYLLFGITGLLILIISATILENVIINFKDTYYVISSISFGFFVLVSYIIYALIYFLIKKNSIYILGILNLIFVTLYIFNLMFTDAVFETIPPIKYLENPILLKITIYTPIVMLGIFLIGNFFLLINIIKSSAMYIKQKAST
jgi:hypothetical protein